MVRPMAKSPPNCVAIGRPDDEQVGSALGGLVDERRPDVAGLEQDRSRACTLAGLGRRLGDVEDPLDLLRPAGDVGVERQRPVDLDDVDADQLGLGRPGELGDERTMPVRSGRRTAPRRRGGTGCRRSATGVGASAFSGTDVRLGRTCRPSRGATIPPASGVVAAPAPPGAARAAVRRRGGPSAWPGVAVRRRPPSRRRQRVGSSRRNGTLTTTVFGRPRSALRAASPTGCRGSAPTSCGRRTRG